MVKAVMKVWNVVTTVIVAAAVVLAVALAGARLVGLRVYAVLSGSMEPAYHTGSLIYVRKADYKKIGPGDVITFMLDEDTVATHRVVGVVPDENDPEVLRFRTKGDANSSEDGGLVHYKNIIGTPVFSIPKLGVLANYISKPPGTYTAISVGSILMLLVFLPDLLGGGEGDKPERRRKPRTGERPERVKRPAPEREERPERVKRPAPEREERPERVKRPAPEREERPARVKRPAPEREERPRRAESAVSGPWAGGDIPDRLRPFR